MSHQGTWTFLSNHAHVLICVARDPHIRMRDLALQIGITERAVQRIVAELKDAGYLSLERQGRRNHYDVHTDLPMRHPIESHCDAQTLLDAILGCESVEEPSRQRARRA